VRKVKQTSENNKNICDAKNEAVVFCGSKSQSSDV